MKATGIQFSVLMLAVLLLAGTAAQAQAPVLPQNWKVAAGTVSWFLASGDNVRGAAMNPATGHVLVATRQASTIVILNPATGDSLGKLDMTGISGGTFAFNRVGVSDDGRIYTTNLVTSITTAAPLKIYTWDNEAAVPKVAFSDSVLGPRVGDALTVVGTGAETYVYVSGNAAPGPVHVFKKFNDSLLTLVKSITPSGWGSGVLGIGPITSGFGSFWINTAGKQATSFDTSGNAVDTLFGTIVSSGHSSVRYLQLYGRKLLILFSGNSSATNPAVARVADITSGTHSAYYLAGITDPLGTTTNTNATGEAFFNWSDSSVVLLSTNNGVGSYSVKKSLPTASSFGRLPFVPLAGQADTVQARVITLEGDAVGAKLRYYADADTVGTEVAMTMASGDAFNGIWNGIIPGSANVNGRRFSYRFTASDPQGGSTTSAIVKGYFSGTTKMTLAGPRAVDTNGVNLWLSYGIRVSGVCTQEDSLIAVPTSRHDVVIQDETGAMDVVEFAVSSVPPPWRMRRGNVYTIVGLIGQFSGHIQVGIPATGLHIDVTDHGPGIIPPPKVITMADLAFDRQGEVLENSLVRIGHVRLTPFSLAWPAAGAPGTNITITDNGTDSLTLRVPALSNANGNPPRQPFMLTGIASQFKSGAAPYKTGYQVIMRHSDDLAAEIMVNVRDTTRADFGTEFAVPVNIENVNGLNITAYQCKVNFDSTVLTFMNANVAGTLSNGFLVAWNRVNGGEVNIAASSAVAMKDSGNFLELRFTLKKIGSSPLAVSVQFNEGAPIAPPAMGVVVAQFQMEAEPNDSLKFANPIAIGIPRAGNLSKSTGDPDFYMFASGTPGHVIIDVTDASNSTDVVIDLFDSTGKTIYEIDRNLNDRLEFNIPAGKYYVRIEGFQASPGSYATGPYVIQVYFGPPTDAREPNDGPLFGFFKVATPANFGYYDTLNTINPGVGLPGFDWDYFSLIMKAGDNVRATVKTKSFDPATTLNGGQLRVYNKSGSLASVSNATGADLALIYAATVADTYYVRFTNAITGGDAWAGPKARYSIRLEGPVGVIDGEALPTVFALEQNYPNPFNPTTAIKYAVPKNAMVRVVVYDLLGREVRTLVNEEHKAGFYEAVWDGLNAHGVQVSTGVYIYRMTAGDFVSTKKMMLLK